MDQPQRVRYFDQQFLRVDDFNAEQEYHRDMRRRHNRMLHTPGIAEGLLLTGDGTGVKVSPGAAIPGGTDANRGGAEIVLATERRQELSSFAANADVYVTIAFAEEETRFKDDAGVRGNTRWLETPKIEAFTSDPTATPPTDPAQPRRVLLGRVTRGGASGKDVTAIDGTGRRLAGSAESEVSLTPRDPAVQEPDWVRLRWSARGQADVRGSLRIQPGGPTPGNLSVAAAITAASVTSGELATGPVRARSLRLEPAGSDRSTDLVAGTLSFHLNGTPASADVAVVNDASGRLTLQSQTVHVLGRLGVATTAPAHHLHVAGNAQVNTMFIGDVGYGPTWTGLSHAAAIGTMSYGLLHSSDGQNTLINKKSGPGSIQFRVDNQTKLTMDDAGTLVLSGELRAPRLGVGTAGAPANTLDVAGDIAIWGKHALQGSDTWLRLNQGLAFTAGTHTPGLFAPLSLNVGGMGGWGNPGANNAWIVGNLGLGTAALDARLNINGDINMAHGNTVRSAGRMHINTGENLFLLAGAGTIISKAWGGPGSLLVDGNVQLGADNGIVTIGGNQNGPFMALHDDMWLSDPQDGSIHVMAGDKVNFGKLAGIFINVSTAELKRDIATVEDQELQRLYDDTIATRVVHYNYTAEASEQRRRLGVIAEETPDYVLDDGGKSIVLMEYASMLHGAIQVLAARLESLERTEES